LHNVECEMKEFQGQEEENKSVDSKDSSLDYEFGSLGLTKDTRQKNDVMKMTIEDIGKV